jgi:hypothetical protein
LITMRMTVLQQELSRIGLHQLLRLKVKYS